MTMIKKVSGKERRKQQRAVRQLSNESLELKYEGLRDMERADEERAVIRGEVARRLEEARERVRVARAERGMPPPDSSNWWIHPDRL